MLYSYYQSVSYKIPKLSFGLKKNYNQRCPNEHRPQITNLPTLFLKFFHNMLYSLTSGFE